VQAHSHPSWRPDIGRRDAASAPVFFIGAFAPSARSFPFLVRKLRPIVQQFLYGTAIFISPSVPRLLRKLRLPFGLRLSEIGLKLGRPLLIPIRYFCELDLIALSLVKCEPDKSEQHQDGSGYKQPMRVLHR
jgi:hypothetical protein